MGLTARGAIAPTPIGRTCATLCRASPQRPPLSGKPPLSPHAVAANDSPRPARPPLRAPIRELADARRARRRRADRAARGSPPRRCMTIGAILAIGVAASLPSSRCNQLGPQCDRHVQRSEHRVPGRLHRRLDDRQGRRPGHARGLRGLPVPDLRPVLPVRRARSSSSRLRRAGRRSGSSTTTSRSSAYRTPIRRVRRSTATQGTRRDGSPATRVRGAAGPPEPGGVGLGRGGRYVRAGASRPCAAPSSRPAAASSR